MIFYITLTSLQDTPQIDGSGAAFVAVRPPPHQQDNYASHAVMVTMPSYLPAASSVARSSLSPTCTPVVQLNQRGIRRLPSCMTTR